MHIHAQRRSVPTHAISRIFTAYGSIGSIIRSIAYPYYTSIPAKKQGGAVMFSALYYAFAAIHIAQTD